MTGIREKCDQVRRLLALVDAAKIKTGSPGEAVSHSAPSSGEPVNWHAVQSHSDMLRAVEDAWWLAKENIEWMGRLTLVEAIAPALSGETAQDIERALDRAIRSASKALPPAVIKMVTGIEVRPEPVRLEVCPICGEARAIVSPETGARHCFHCDGTLVA